MDAALHSRGRKSSKPAKPALKFRSSCDACADSKVRCDKQHPSCGRCLRGGHSCKYSLSLRMGKVAAASVMAARKAANQPMQSPPSATESVEPVHSMHRRTSSMAAISATTPDHPAAMPVSFPVFQHPEFQTHFSRNSFDHVPMEDPSNGLYMDVYQDLDGYMFFETPSHLSPSPLEQNPGMIVDTPSPQTAGSEYRNPPTPLSWSSNGIDNIAVGGMSDSSAYMPHHMGCMSSPPHMNTPNGFGEIVYTTSTEHDCVNSAKSLLHSLNMLSVPKEDSYPALSRDQALRTCSNATKQLSALLNCICEYDPHLPFLIAVISSKVLAIYGDVAQISCSPYSNTGGLAFNSVPPAFQTYHHYGDEREDMVTLQLVFHELQTMSQLEERFRERYCKGAKAEDRGVYIALEEFMKKRLRETMDGCRIKLNSHNRAVASR